MAGCIAASSAHVVGVLRLLGLMLLGCVAWVLRRRAAPRPAGRRLEDRRKGFYDTLFAMNVLSLMTEVPVLLLILASVVDPAVRGGMHGLEALALVVLLGDRWHVLAGGHVLTPTHLDLHAGARAHAVVPLDAIASIETLPRKTSRRAWCRAHGVPRGDTGVVSVLDAPNLVITLHPGVGLRWLRLQSLRPMPRHLFVYLDSPERLAAAIDEAVGLARAMAAR